MSMNLQTFGLGAVVALASAAVLVAPGGGSENSSDATENSLLSDSNSGEANGKNGIGCIEIPNATGSDEADTANLLEAFDKVVDNGCIEFAAGQAYRLKIGQSLSIDGHENVKIDGNGATLTITDFDAGKDRPVLPGVITLRKTRNAKVEDLTIRLERPNHLFGTVSGNGANPGDGRFSVVLDPGYVVTPREGDPSRIYSEHVMHWETPEMPGTYETFAAVVTCPGGCSAATTTLDITAPAHQEQAVGQRMLIMQDKRQTRGIELDDSVNAKIEKIRFGNMPGAAISGQRVTDVTITDITSTAMTETVSQVSVNDLVYIRGAAGRISLENVFANYQTDDAFNLHQPQTRVRTVAGGNYDFVAGVHPPSYIAIGDTVLFYDQDLQPLGTAVVTEVSATNIKTLRKVARVHYIVPAKWVPASVKLENYHVASGRSRILIKAPKVTVSGCSSRNNMMSAIDVRYRNESVAEAGISQNVTIENCIFDNVARRGSQHVAAVIVSADTDVTNSPWPGLVTMPVHGTVTVDNNQFLNLRQSAILFHAAKSVNLRGNRFQWIGNTPDPTNIFNRFFPNGFKAGAYTVAFAATDAALLENNGEDGGLVNFGCVSEPEHPQREAICATN